jgi:ABC-type lipoprotein export system ATPase subunit
MPDEPNAARRMDPVNDDAVVVAAAGLVRTFRQGGTNVSALRGVSLTIERGELVAVMGPSGSGKSTLLHLLGGLDAADRGSIVVAGQRLEALSEEQRTLFRRRTVGFVFQSFNLVPTLTVEENVALPLLLDGTTLHAARPRVHACLEGVGLEIRGAHMPEQLSGGEAQRAAVARALIGDPPVVLADEPTGSLDSRTAEAVLQLLRRAASDRRRAVLMVTHDPRAAAHASRVVRMIDGAIVDATGPTVLRTRETASGGAR